MENYIYDKCVFKTINTILDNNTLKFNIDNTLFYASGSVNDTFDMKDIFSGKYDEHLDILNIISIIYIHNKKYSKGLKLLNYCISKNYKIAEYNLGQYYFDVEKEYSLAIECFENSKLEVVNSNYKLFLIYKRLGQLEELKKLLEYFMLSLDNPESLYNIGLYYSIIGDISKSTEYFNMAVEKGNHVDAMFMLGKYYKKIKDYVKAEQYFLWAIERGHVDSMFSLGNLYYSNKINSLDDDNLTASEKYYIMASNKNHIGSLKKMGKLYSSTSGEKLKGMYYLTMAYALTKNKDIKDDINNWINTWEYGKV